MKHVLGSEVKRMVVGSPEVEHVVTLTRRRAQQLVNGNDEVWRLMSYPMTPHRRSDIIQRGAWRLSTGEVVVMKRSSRFDHVEKARHYRWYYVMSTVSK